MSSAEKATAAVVVRRLVVVGGALALAVLVVRAAFVGAYAEHSPQIAARAWPGHPDVTLSLGFAQIGEAAALGKAPPESAFAAVAKAARAAPLAAEPFLVRGVSAQTGGNVALAERAFRQAERRDPRSRAAHFFLADLYARSGRVGEGLRQIASLTRLVPGSRASMAPYLAQFAKTPAAAPEVKALLRDEPELAPILLGELAKDASNVELVLGLANGLEVPGDQRWRIQIVNALVSAGQFGRAREVWSRLNGVAAPTGLFDPKFEGREALPPFNWTFASGEGGVAEARDGRLEVVFYGRDNTVLAGQLLTLWPGRYRLTMEVVGSAGLESLLWRVTCFQAKRPIAEVPLDLAGQNGALAAEFDVPSGCPAQQFELIGDSPDVPRQVEASISNLALASAGR